MENTRPALVIRSAPLVAGAVGVSILGEILNFYHRIYSRKHIAVKSRPLGVQAWTLSGVERVLDAPKFEIVETQRYEQETDATDGMEYFLRWALHHALPRELISDCHMPCRTLFPDRAILPWVQNFSAQRVCSGNM